MFCHEIERIVPTKYFEFYKKEYKNKKIYINMVCFGNNKRIIT